MDVKIVKNNESQVKQNNDFGLNFLLFCSKLTIVTFGTKKDMLNYQSLICFRDQKIEALIDISTRLNEELLRIVNENSGLFDENRKLKRENNMIKH